MRWAPYSATPLRPPSDAVNPVDASQWATLTSDRICDITRDGGQRRLVLAGLSLVFYLRVPLNLEAGKGWRRFQRGLVAPFADLRAGRFAGEHGGNRLRAKSPRTGDKTDGRSKGGQEFAPAPKSPNRFRALAQADGRQPFQSLTSLSRTLPLSLIPSVAPCEAGTAAFRRRVRRLSSSDKSLCHSSGFLSSNSEKRLADP